MIDEKVTKYIESLYKPLSPALSMLRSVGEAAWIPIIRRDVEGLLLSLLRLQQPMHILEIGTAIGYSAACFATVCESSHIITIESDEAMYASAIQNLNDLELTDRVDVRLGDGGEILNQMDKLAQAGDMECFDFVFIDAAKSHYKVFWDGAIKLSKRGSIILCDNILMDGRTASDTYDPSGKHKTNIRKMREFVEYITTAECADTCVISVADGISISVVK